MATYEQLITPAELRREARVSVPRPPAVDARALERALREAVRGEVRFDAGSQALYALDASNYRQIPIGVVIPRGKEDVVSAVAVCREHRAPMVSRAGGTAMAGQTVNHAVVLDFSKYMHHILELDPIDRYAIVEPGVICDQLAGAAKPFQLTWGPQPATHNRCGFGGMLGNNSCGIHAQMAGKAVDDTEAMQVLLYDGTIMDVGWITDAEFRAKARGVGREAEVYRKLDALRRKYDAAIRDKYPKLPRRVSGYNLDQLLPGPDGRFNLARALVGSEGTLVTILNAKVRLVWDHPARVLLILGYPDIFSAADHVTEILPFGPIGLEGVDEKLQQNIKAKGSPHEKAIPLLPKGKGYLFVEIGYGTQDEALEQARRIIEKLRADPQPPVDVKIVTSHAEQNELWGVREAGLGSTAFVPGQPDAWPGWEDSAVRPELLGGYLRDLHRLYEIYDYHPALYGHFGMGCVHCRVQFDLYTDEGVAKYRRFVEEAAELVARYDGSLSGEHGDGQSRAELLPIMFGPQLVEAFREFKRIWDPDGKMNPGKVVDPYPITSDLRLGGDYAPREPKTFFKYPEDDGSFARATMRCVGIGRCRRLKAEAEPERDVMCPSYMVTREEKHTTRGRAHLLHEMLLQNAPTPIEGGWRDENVKESLDLCLSCKGCKGDCPVNVDMATYKAEFLAHYYKGRLHPRSAYAFGYVDKWARLASLAPGLVNLVTQTPGPSALAKRLAGMAPERSIPPFADETFQRWFARRPRVNAGNEKVVLWPDTFNNFFHPEVAQAAVRVLEAAGFEVVVPDGHLCCGRPLYDYGLLPSARRYLKRVLRAMSRHLEARTPIVVLEPSCASVFRDELHGMFPERDDAKRLKQQTVLLSEFLTMPSTAYTPPKLQRKAIVQGHCHHKSVLKFQDESKLLDQIGLDYELLASGCCGMAGSFGFEGGEKYEVSVAEGWRVLLPAVRDAETSTLVIADGFSCKTQIGQSTSRHALHVAQVLDLALRHGEGGPAPQSSPEHEVVQERRHRIRRSMRRAGALVLAGVAVAALVGAGRRALRL